LVERAVARASQRPRHEPQRLAAHAAQIALVALLHLRLPTTGARAPGDTRRADLVVRAWANLAVAAHVRGGRGRLEHGDRNPEPDHPGVIVHRPISRRASVTIIASRPVPSAAAVRR